MAEAVTRALCIAIVGAESTGKTSLAACLAQQLGEDSRLRVAWVPEVLRAWCEAAGRTPLAHEQASILVAQHGRIDAAAATHDIVVCDTTALMTAVYSGLVFGDHSLDERAALLHRRGVAITLLTALDLPWVGDGLQRDGPHVQVPVDSALRRLMQQHGIEHAVISGRGETRVQRALAAVAASVASVSSLPAPDPQARPRGLFTGLAEPAAANHASRRAWACECCLPDEERALRRRPAPTGPAQ